MRNAGGNVQPYISDVMFMDKLVGWDLKELIIIHHQGSIAAALPSVHLSAMGRC
jgi:hypothetical protein